MFKKNVKKSLAVILTMVLALSICLVSNAVPAQSATNFANGADIGWLNQMENAGVTWQNDSGTQQDPIAILKAHNIDSIRLRVFVNPPSNYMWTKNDGTTVYLGYGDQTGVVWMAQRAKNAGISRIMVDFHYSDHFADPAYQDIPSAWVGHSFSQLLTDVYDHTYNVMTALKNAGITPEWVQVGNEITNGMLWTYGSTSNWSQLTQLINSGYDAVKAVSPSSKVVIHLDKGANNSMYRSWFDNFNNNGGKWDAIGMSYYPYWDNVDYTQNLSALSANLNDMASRYGKEVLISEVGGLETNPSNTQAMVSNVIAAVKAVPNGKGIGVFYWEPEANSSVLPDKYPLGATSKVTSNVLKFTSAVDAFLGSASPNTSSTFEIISRNSGKALNVVNGSTSDGANTEQYTYGGWVSQKWQFVDAGGGYYKIKNVNSGKLLDISGASTADGASAIQYYDNGGYNQQWSFVSTGDGYFKIKNRKSGKILDVYGVSTDDGAKADQWTDNGGWNQQWSLVKVD